MMGASAVAIGGSLIRVISRSSNCNCSSSRRRSISVCTRTSSCSTFVLGGPVAEVAVVVRKSFSAVDFQLIRNRTLVLPPPRLSLSHSLSISSSFGHISSCNSSAFFSTSKVPPPLAPTSLMSSRLGSALTSTFSGTRLEAFFTSEIRWRHASNLTRPSHVKADRLLRCNFQARISAWCEGRVVKFMNRTMDSEKRRIECYSTSQTGGSDPPVSSSVLPPVKRVLKAKGLAIRFCPRCGGATEEKIPVGEHELRFVCTSCGAVHYQNPKMVVGCLVEHEGKVLLCKRNIEPSYGLWTLPAGYMEIGESAAEGAARETREEACADVQVLAPFAHLDIPFIGQSYIIFRARLKEPHFSPGPESLECALFKLNELPFEGLAFSSIHVALSMYVEDMKEGRVKVHHGVIDKRPGASPSDLKGFVVRDVLSN